ncbi:uncharacterized protein BCR38DRAFT_459715 [Pseudomassariella vexata]|uniref:polynucleotide adenylyltransferase n=1 Tax=Pseudomassariella vexata TaxID=1141098 RepID=A0A1Y2DPX1_9PEZI|nr:uncharacterized protein BCR38DRAFT_459715 [Pseudomassariella vexata]ORY60705.1 hypothetical protein BCR38DRAFT_459715 [Pseudomassariella vexata]
MDARPTAADSKHHYHPPLWSRSTSSPAVPRLSITAVSAKAEPSHSPFPTRIDLVPILFPQQSSLYQAQLLQYNKLIAPGRGRGGVLQTTPLPPLLTTPNVHTGLRSRSSPKVSNKDSSRAKPGTQNCHGNRGTQNTNKADRALITGAGKEPASSSKMPPKMPISKKTAMDLPHPLPSRPAAVTMSPANLTAIPPQTHSNSVPSTPHQRARKFSFESREPSPNANQSHSPRSAYSETNSNLPSLRPLPPRNGGCQFETVPERSRRRMPYSLGSDRLEKLDLTKIKSKLSDDDERNLTADMRELYDRLKPTNAVEANRQRLVQKLEKLLNDTWPGHDICVHLFGSSGNLLCSDDSDVDICITTPWKELEGVCMLADLLAKHGMEKVVCVSSAKVPIVKIWDPELGLACDMNVNNTLALENTRMIRTYVEIDERVRPLAMIIKYWTRRRIVNDAAFGGTLSSYTWICMIIAFLQLRQPPIVPALHQRPHQKTTKKDEGITAFADDITKLRGFGEKNTSTLGELLFQFFRFYAHEFDYAEAALSIRLGKLMKKTERRHWHLAINNQLCVEEPFNTMRNLGNTVDDTSFRGIHLELRRAFELISEGKLADCCEQYVFPKEEERIWQKPAQAPRPALIRSASQQHNRGGRGANLRGGNRQQGQYRNSNHGNNRRASSSTNYEPNPSSNNAMYFQGYPFMTSQDGIYMQPEVVAQTLSALQLQENNLRFLQYTQNQALAQQQALAHAQRMQGTASQAHSSTERSRTNSFDNPPLTAPLRPDMFYYPLQYHQNQAYYTHPGLTTYPSSPSSQQAADQRRSSHRSTTISDVSAVLSGSSLRSQSQPASRPIPVMQPNGTFSEADHRINGVANIPARHVNGIPIPSFIPDEGNDSEHEPTATHTPPSEERYPGSYLDAYSPGRRARAAVNGLPAFGDIGPQGSGQGRRRLSSDQFPQSVLDRIKRTSRSPSPLGHNRAYSVGTNSAPLASAPFPPAGDRPVQDMKPLVVNGSVSKPSNASSARHSLASEESATEELVYDNPLRISQRPNAYGSRVDALPTYSPAPAQPEYNMSPDRPLVVNGTTSTHAHAPSQPGPQFTNDVITMTPNGNLSVSHFSPLTPESAAQFSPAMFSGFIARQSQSPLIAQLDLAMGDRVQTNDLQHLSPVYETRTPSPTATRKFELPMNQNRMQPNVPGQGKDAKESSPKTKQKSPVDTPSPRNEAASLPLSNPRLNGLSRENGHVKGTKNESEHASGWQKIPKGRKKGPDGKGKNDAYSQGESMPKNDLERKGG